MYTEAVAWKRLPATTKGRVLVKPWEVPMVVEYTLTRGCEASRNEPGCADEVCVMGVEIGDVDVYQMLTIDQLDAIEAEVARKLKVRT